MPSIKGGPQLFERLNKGLGFTAAFLWYVTPDEQFFDIN